MSVTKFLFVLAIVGNICLFSSVEFTQNEKDWIKQNPVIKYTGDPNWLPFEGSKNEEHIGIAADYVKEIERITGLYFKYIPSKTWTEATEKVLMKNVSMLVETTDSLLDLIFTKPFASNYIVMVMRDDSEYIYDLNTLSNKKIAVIKDYGYVSQIKRDFKDLDFHIVDDIHDGLASISTGKYDVLLCTFALGSYTISEMGLHNVKIVGKTHILTELGFGITKENAELVNILNKALSEISQKRKYEILDAWVYSKYVEKIDYTLVFWIIAIAAFVILLTIYWNRMLRIEVKKRKLVEDELKYKNEEIQNYLDIAQVLIMVLDKDKNVIMINQEGADILGYLKEEIIGKNWIENFIPKNMQSYLEKIGDDIICNKNNHTNREDHVLTKSGEERLLHWNKRVILDNKGNSIGILTSGIDITEKKATEKLLFTQSRHAAMGEMISMIAHQWRQPLSTISMTANNSLLSLELGDISEAEFEKGAKDILSQTSYLSRTIDDFRNFFSPDNNKETVSLRSVIEDSINIFGVCLKNDNIELIVDIRTETSINIYSRELLQVYINLMKNAKDALINNKTDKPTIKITLTEDTKYINSTVSDNGGGIPINIIDKIFDPYFTTKSTLNGTGIGLHMCKTIIEKHMNGLLTVENKNDAACFSIKLPKKIDG